MQSNHRLKADGAPHDDNGNRIGTKTSGEGRARCTCGWLSEDVGTRAARRQAHADHVTEAETPPPVWEILESTPPAPVLPESTGTPVTTEPTPRRSRRGRETMTPPTAPAGTERAVFVRVDMLPLTYWPAVADSSLEVARRVCPGVEEWARKESVFLYGTQAEVDAGTSALHAYWEDIYRRLEEFRETSEHHRARRDALAAARIAVMESERAFLREQKGV